MSTAENKAIVRRFIDEVGFGQRLDLLDELVSRDFVNHNPLPGLPPDFDGLRQAFTTLHGAFPDFHGTIDRLIAEDDLVVFHGMTRGTHRGEFLGTPPTGREVAFAGIVIFRVTDGKIVERWAVLDTLTLLRQIGAIPGGA